MAKWQQQQESPSTQLSLNDRTAEAGKELLEIIKSKSLLNQVPYSRFSSWRPALWMDLGFECSCCAPWVPHFNTAEEEHLVATQQAAPSLSHLLQRRCQLLLTHHNRDRRENPGEIPYILTVKTSDAAYIHMDLPLPHQKNQCNATAEDDTFEYFPWNWDIS